MKIAILGCGPAGLLIAHAARLNGHIPIIFSDKKISPMRGAQYQHVPIPGLPKLKPEKLRYTLIGTLDGYREKVYGANDPDITVSPEEFKGFHDVWDLRHTYQLLWRQFHNNIIDRRVSPNLLRHLVDSFPRVFSTVPAPILCTLQNVPGEIAVTEHAFNYKNVWIDSSWHGPMPEDDPDAWADAKHLVICNGLSIAKHSKRQAGWYRTSFIYSNVNTEWASQDTIQSTHSIPGKLFSVRKPISNTCSCWPTVIRAGRYGAWTKGVLTHDAFQEAMDILALDRNLLRR